MVAWGVGWCIGAVIFALAFLVLSARRAEVVTTPLILLGSAVSFGVPTYLAARRNGSRRPIVQALVWVIVFTIGGIALSEHFLARTALASPGELNINTYETMRARQASFDRWGVEPEVVSSFVFTFAVVVASSFGSGLLSALAVSGVGIIRLIRGTLFGLATAIAIIAGLVVIYIGGYVLALVIAVLRTPAFPLPVLPSGFALAIMLAGCTAGSLIEYARGALLPRGVA